MGNVLAAGSGAARGASPQRELRQCRLQLDRLQLHVLELENENLALKAVGRGGALAAVQQPPGTMMPAGFLHTMAVEDVDRIVKPGCVQGARHRGRAGCVAQELAVCIVDSDSFQVALLGELRVQAAVRSDQLAMLLAVCPVRSALAYPWAAFGSVKDYISSAAPPAPDLALEWLLGASRGLQVLHDHGLVHSDIRASRILLFAPGASRPAPRPPQPVGLASAVPRLGGCWGVHEENDAASGVVPSAFLSAGAHPYLDPVMLTTGCRSCRGSDMFALGVAVLELLLGRSDKAGQSELAQDDGTCPEVTQTRRLRPVPLWQQFLRALPAASAAPSDSAAADALRRLLPHHTWHQEVLLEVAPLVARMLEVQCATSVTQSEDELFLAVQRPAVSEVIACLELARVQHEAMQVPQRERVCLICMDAEVDARLRPCSHAALCRGCASMCMDRREKCPICRGPITGFDHGAFDQTYAAFGAC